MNLSLSSVVMKLNTIDEWDLASRYSRFPSQHSGLACWSVSYLMTYSISSSCTSLLLQMFPSKSFIFSMLTLAWKYSMSGSAETRVFSVKIFLILFMWPRRSSAVLLVVVVMIGFPFLDQFTAMACKYSGTSKLSRRVLMSLQGRLAFLCSVSGMGRLNCSMRQWGFALGLGGVFGCAAVGLMLCFGWV